MRFILISSLALSIASAACAKPGDKPIKSKPSQVDELDFQLWQTAMWRDQAAQLELEAAHRRVYAAQAAAADSKVKLEALRADLNRQYQLTTADKVDDAPPHKIMRAP